MEKLVILGGARLSGEVEISGAKNSAVAILAASIMVKGKCRIDNVPHVSDIDVLLGIIKGLGGKAEFVDKSTVEIDCTNLDKYEADYETVRRIRASSYLMGALLGRFHRARVGMPGGCDFGVRPIDQHIKGFKILGTEVEVDHGMVDLKADRLIGDNVYLDVVSVGATINIMLAATLAEGITVIESAAKEPHIVDVANFLNCMGANIKGAGTDVIKIKGVPELHGGEFSVIPDQIEAGTFMIAAVLTGGTVTLCGAQSEHIKPLTAKMREIGVDVDEVENCITVKSNSKLKSCDIKTMPFPGFPTDMQAQFCALLSIVPGTSIITETVFENRFMYVSELQKMGAKIKIDGRTAVIEGTKKLSGARVSATDLRAGAALVVAGLAANGTTKIGNAGCIDRGYEDFDKKLSSLGAYVEKLIR